MNSHQSVFKAGELIQQLVLVMPVASCDHDPTNETDEMAAVILSRVKKATVLAPSDGGYSHDSDLGPKQYNDASLNVRTVCYLSPCC